MKVTKIVQQQRRQDRYSIYVDDQYCFSLGEGEFLQSGLVSGRGLTAGEIEKFKQQSQEGKLYEKMLNLLSFRPRSEWELSDYLKRKKIKPKVIEKILNKLSKNGYVNDLGFARRWVESRRLLKPTSKRRLRQELLQKRIAPEIIDQVLAADETEELEVLKELVQRKRTRYPDKLKFMQYLARQGYNYDDIKTVLDELH